jgi:L-seryl-tRNA(Ser) seleniumtransferase
MLTCPIKELDRRAKRLQRKLNQDLPPVCRVQMREESSQVGGGAFPLQVLPTRVIALRPLKGSAANLEEKLRRGDPPVIARVKDEEVLLDLRTVTRGEEEALLQGLRQALK